LKERLKKIASTAKKKDRESRETPSCLCFFSFPFTTAATTCYIGTIFLVLLSSFKAQEAPRIQKLIPAATEPYFQKLMVIRKQAHRLFRKKRRLVQAPGHTYLLRKETRKIFFPSAAEQITAPGEEI
jgi:hypothetical protein